MAERIKKNWHAATSTGKSRSIDDFSSFLPIMFHSPYIDTDLQIFEGIWQNTLVGTAIDCRVEYAIGRGLKPTFYLRDKSIKDSEQKKNLLSEYDDIQSELMRIDNLKRINMKVKAADILRNSHVFGRSLLANEYDDAGTLYSLKPIHARDLSRVFVHQSNWTVSSVYAFQKAQLIDEEDMIYMVQFPYSPIRRGYWYGFSSIQRLMGQARAMRAINEFDIPEVAQALWAKYGTFVVNQDGMTESEKTADLNTLKRGMKAGGFNFITGSGNPDDVRYFAADTEPKVADLATIKDSVDRDIIGNFQIPGGMFGREADQTRATMIGKINLFKSGPVESDRRWLSDTLVPQWYERNIIKMGQGDILEKVGIEITYEPLIIENWTDNVDAVIKLKNLFPSISEDELLRLCNLEDMIGKLKPSTVMNKENLETMQEQTENPEFKSKLQQQVEKKS